MGIAPAPSPRTIAQEQPRETMGIPKISRTVLFFAMTGILLASGFLLTRDLTQIADEQVHYQQILNILHKRFFTIHPFLVMFPGYHWTVALPSLLLNDSRGIILRLTTTILSFFCILAFFLLAKRIDKDTVVRKSFLFVLSPLIFPFFSLIYTDIYSMAFVLLSLYFALNQRLWLSGIVGILGLLVRQNNIVWLAFIALVAYLESYAPQHRWKDVKQWISKFFFFFLAAILIVVFIIWNKGFVLGDREHQPLILNFNNLFFLLFLLFFLFLPYHIANFPKILRFLKTHKLMAVVLVEVFLVFVLFFKSDHHYNQFARFLHNWILFAMTGPFPTRCLCFLPIAYSILSLCVTPLKRKSFYFLYPFTILYLLPNAVIEIRYCFIPYTLFLLFKEPDSERISLFTIATYLVPIVVIMNLLMDASFFP